MQSLIRVLLAIGFWAGMSGPAHAAWLRAESSNFIVFAEQPEPQLRERVAMLEEYAQLLRKFTRTEAAPSPHKLRVYLVRGSDELRLIREVPTGAAGVYIANASGIAAVANMQQGFRNPLAVLFHEYAHHFMAQYQGRVYPAWYAEGFAEFMMTARFTDRAVEFGHLEEVRGRELADPARWLPMEDVLFRVGHPAETRGRYYAQSWLLTHYLLNDTARLQRFRAYLAALQRGESPPEAFQRSFDMTPNELGARLRPYAFRELTYLRMPRVVGDVRPAISIERLPPSADDLLLLQGALHVGPSNDQDTLARVRRAAARHSDPFARRVLAQAEAVAGNGAVADRLIDELLAGRPNDAELMYFRGMRYMKAARLAPSHEKRSLHLQARRWFGRAHRLDRNHFPTLYRYAETHVSEPNFVSENNLEVLLLAHTLAPQVGEIRLAAARMLLAAGDFELAESLLLPMVGTAHQGRLTDSARDALAQARSRSRGAAALVYPVT